MKVTVAARIIGGFAVITALLVVLGLYSLSKFSGINQMTDEVNTLAFPTVSGSGQLKVSFLNMGRLTSDAYYEQDSAKLNAHKRKFVKSQEVFEQEIATLKKVVVSEAALKNKLQEVETVYQSYVQHVLRMFKSRADELALEESILTTFSSIEDNADDTSSLIVDFADLDEVQNDSKLAEAAEIGNRLESYLMSLLTVGAEYIKTNTAIRADTIGNEVSLLESQIAEQLSQMLQTAGNNNYSDTLGEISDLTKEILEAVSSENGLLKSQVARLRLQVTASSARSASDASIEEAIASLNDLQSLADNKAASIKEQVTESVDASTRNTIIISLISIVLASGIGYFTVIAIIRPLHRVNDILFIVASGDLTHKLDVSSQDEFGKLASNCNNLIDSLKELISGITTRATQLAAASEETSTITQQTTHSIQEQKAQVGQVAAATNEMHSTSELVTKSAEDTLNEIKHADIEAEKVKVISEENRRIIEVLAKDVDEAANVINKLHQDSASIGGILDVIRGVADQTNLLALNAAIEAARAGEQGRGFAVVADEVRTLASRTQESTQEINSMIEVLQAGAEKAVAVMNQGKEQTTLCVQQTEKATDALHMITEAVHRAYDVSSQIEQSAREQNLVSEDISMKLENIVEIAEQTTTGAHQTAESSHEVARLAEELQASIKQFKV